MFTYIFLYRIRFRKVVVISDEILRREMSSFNKAYSYPNFWCTESLWIFFYKTSIFLKDCGVQNKC